MAVSRQHLFQKRDRLRQLEAFCHAAKLGSMTRAAEQLLISQPAVSLHVRELEHELETSLFDRSGPRISLSPAGERLFELATPLVEGVNELYRVFGKELEDLVSGDLHVVSGDAGAIYILPRVLKRLRDQHPGVRAHVKSGDLGSGLAMLLEGGAELVLGAEEPVAEYFEYRPVLYYDVVLVTSRDHPLAGRESVSPEEIAACPVIVPDFGPYSPRSGQSPIRHLGIEASGVIEVGGWDVVEHFVEAGLGVAFHASFCISEASRVSVIPLDRYFPKRSYGWFVRRGKSLSWVAERLVEAMAEEFPDDARVPSPPGR